MADYGNDDFLGWANGAVPWPTTSYDMPPLPPMGGQAVGFGSPVVEETAAPVPAAETNDVEFSPVGSALLDISEPSVEQPVNAQPAQFGAVNDELPPLPPAGDPWASTAQVPWAQMNQEDMLAAAHEDPAGFRKYDEAKTTEADLFTQRRQGEEVLADEGWRQRNEKRLIEGRRQADELTAQVQAEADRLSADGGYFEQRGTWGAVRDVVSAMLGGLLQGKQGGPNIGLQMMEQRIDQHIAAQRARIADKRSAASQAYQRLGDDYAFDEAMRIAAWKGVAGKLMTERQNLDPQGTQYREATKNILMAEGQAAKALQDFNMAQQDRALKNAETISKIEKTQAEAAALRQKSMGGGGYAAPSIPRAQVLAKTGVDPGRDLTDKEYDQLLRRASNEAELSGKRAESTTKEAAAAGLEVSSPEAGGKLQNEDGSVYRARDKDEAKQVGKALHVARMTTDLIDEILDIRDKVGGETSWGNSNEYQRLDQLKNSLVNIKKAGMEGMSSDEDLKRIEAALGAKDPTSFRDQTAGLKSARDFTENELNSRLLREWNYTGQAVKLKNRKSSGAKPAKTNVQELGERAVAAGNLAKHKVAWGLTGPMGTARAVQDAVAQEKQNLEAIRQLGGALREPAQQAEALAMLRSLGKSAPTESIRAAANKLVSDFEVNSRSK